MIFSPIAYFPQGPFFELFFSNLDNVPLLLFFLSYLAIGLPGDPTHPPLSSLLTF